MKKVIGAISIGILIYMGIKMQKINEHKKQIQEKQRSKAWK